MPFYRDIFPYAGRDVCLLKRIQITASDLHIAFKGSGYGRFDDIADLTIFADNLVPHVLMLDGILQYSDALAGAIAAGQSLASGSDEEIELRACVHAVELMREELARRNVTVTSQGLDYLLEPRTRRRIYQNPVACHQMCFLLNRDKKWPLLAAIFIKKRTDTG